MYLCKLGKKGLKNTPCEFELLLVCGLFNESSVDNFLQLNEKFFKKEELSLLSNSIGLEFNLFTKFL